MITYSNKKAYNQIWSPMGRYPMIDNTIFETYAEALAFATNNSVAVVGNIITVTSDEDSSKNGAYVLVCDGKLTNASQPTGLKKLESDIDLSNYVTKDQISNIYIYKGTKATYADLPSTSNTIGDVWNVEAVYTTGNKTYPAGTNWAWNGKSWDALAGSIDLSGYATSEKVSTIENKVDENAAGLVQIDTELSAAVTEINKKVTAEPGKELIPSTKLTLISTNESNISNLKTRMSTVEASLTWGTIS